MTQPRGRSSSLQRGTRAASAKRAHRASTPRRLSDLQERPAWDATSSNLDKFKLTAEEQERRKASRVSKNRPLASSDAKRSFVEAWAKHVTESVLREDTEPDQDRPRGSSTGRERDRDLPINYSSVVDMLRKSPLPSTATAAAASTQMSDAVTTNSTATTNGDASNRGQGAEGSGAAAAAAGAAVGSVYSPAPDGFGQEEDAQQSAEFRSHPTTTHGAAVPGTAASAVAGPRPGGASAAVSGQTGHPGAWLGAQGRGGREAASGAAGGNGGGSGGGQLHRADVSITPAAVRPRFNPAEATTIIAFGDESDEEEQPGGEETCTAYGMSIPADAAVAGSGGGGGLDGLGGRGADPMTAAFEAALFGRRVESSAAESSGGGGVALGNGPTLAWATSRSAASPLVAAVPGVELRLRALEAALDGTRPGLTGGASGLVQEELAELRLELRKVQSDNAKLRQELTAFSSHASSLLTQLQAQMRSLISGGPTPAVAGTSAAAPPPPLGAAAAARTTGQTAATTRQVQGGLTASSGATALNTGTGAVPAVYSVSGRHAAPHGDVYGARRDSVPQPYQPAPEAPMPQPQPVVRRNIFADLDISSLRPMATAAARPGVSGGDGDGNDAATTPYAAYRGAVPPASAAGAAASPLMGATGVSGAPYTVPVRDVDESEVVLPSFAAFRRSAGATAFTSTARPATSGAAAEALTSPYLAPSTTAAGGPNLPSSRLSPPGVQPTAAATAVQPRPFPTQYQPRSLGGVIVRPGGSRPASMTPVGATAAAAAGGANAASGAYVTSLTAAAATAAATGSDAAAVELTRSHSGLPQPLVFSMGPEFRTARASGLSADNSMSLSAHTAAAAAARSRASVPAAAARGGGGPRSGGE